MDKKRRKETERGFMLLDLLLVISLLLLTAALAMPAATSLKSHLTALELDCEARQFMAEIRYVEEMAATYRRIDSKFTAAANETRPTIRLAETGYRLMQSNKTLRRHALPDGMYLKCAESRTELIFSGGEALTATVSFSKNGKTRYVIIDRVGRVRLSEYPATPES